MKNKLLLTTALALFVGSVSNVYAEEKSGKIDYQETITVSQGQELTLDNAYTEEDGDDEGILYTSKFTVENGGTLTASDTDIVATSATGNAIELKGTVVLDGTSIMAGDNNESKRNMLIDGADITFNTTSDLLAAIGDLTIKNTVIKATNLNSEDEDDADLAGLNALGKINIENSTINAPDSMIVSGRDIDEDEGTSFGGDDITISGSSTDINIEEIGIYGEGNIYINDGKITAQAIGAEHGNLNIVGGTVNLIEGSDGLYADETLNVKGGIVNITGQNRIGAEKFKMSDGELNVKGTTYVYTNNPVDISGGSLNIADGAIFGWKTVDSDSDIDFGKNATLNLSGTLNANIESLGTINVKNNSAKIAGSAEISEGGILNIGENKLTVAGDITFDESSTLKMSVTDKGNGSLSARNIVAEKDAKLVLDVTKSMNVGDETTATLFSATGKADNNFTNEISNERYKVTTEDGKTYKIVYENTASDVIDNVDDSTEINKSTAEAWDSLRNAENVSPTTQAVASTLNTLSQTNPKAYADALTALAPDTAPAVQQAASETAGQVFSAVGSRLSGGSIASSNQGMSSGDELNGIALWVQGMFNHAKMNNNKHSKGFDSDTWGTALGLEKQFNRAVKAGIGYAYSKTDIDGFMRDTDVKTHTALVYGEYKPSNWYVNVVASYGWSDYEEDKNVAGINVKSKYDVEALGLQAMTGYDIYTSAFNITPEAGLRYVHIKQDTYTDTAGQRVKSKDTDTLTGVLGAKVSKSYTISNGMLFKPEVKVAMTYDISHDNSQSTVTLVNGSVYNVSGKPLNRFGVELGAGVTAELCDDVELSLGYEGKFRKDYQDHTGLINAKYKF